MSARSLPIFTFHALDHATSSLSMPPARFRRLLAALRARGYCSLELAEAADVLRRRRPLPARACAITFDDGYASVYREGFPALADHGFTATVFLTTGERASCPDGRLPAMEARQMLSWREIREMRDHGIAFGAHTLTHPDLTRLDDREVERQVRESSALIADMLGTAVPCFAYPFGRYDQRVRAIVAQWCACACSDKLGLASHRSDLHALERVEGYYLRGDRTTPLLDSRWLGWYLAARNVPRALRRRLRARTVARHALDRMTP